MFFIGYGCSFIDGPASFRTAWGLQYVPCVLLMIGLPFLPRSPRWLAKVDRTEEAITTLARIQANGDVNDPLVVAEWEEITTVLVAERSAAPGWRKFVQNGMWKRTFAGFSVQAWQQLSGANIMTYYVVYVFAMAKYVPDLVSPANFRPLTAIQSPGEYPLDLFRCPVRALHRFHFRDLLLHRQNQSTRSFDLGGSLHGGVPLRRRGCFVCRRICARRGRW